jgi:hypothetical protein
LLAIGDSPSVQLPSNGPVIPIVPNSQFLKPHLRAIGTKMPHLENIAGQSQSKTYSLLALNDLELVSAGCFYTKRPSFSTSSLFAANFPF